MRYSLIVPLYNREDTIRACLDSLLSQTISDYEIIIVDDGSTDNSGKIADEYAQNHEKIKVIHKQNGGASSARNVGIDNASGEYILFPDSDDKYEKNLLDEVDKFYGNDLIVFGYNTVYSKVVEKTQIVDNFMPIRMYKEIVEQEKNRKEDLAKNGISPLSEKWRKNLEETMEIAKINWMED